MKLVSLNIEGNTHLSNVRSFLQTQQADVVCLMEAPENFSYWLKSVGYTVTFAPTTMRTDTSGTFTEGVMLASKQKHTAQCRYYHQPQPSIVHLDTTNPHHTVARAVIIAHVASCTIATTHFTWTPNGYKPDTEQTTTLETLFNILAPITPHYLVGDFNIPRYHNPLYEKLTTLYVDTIPPSYGSSLDKSLHRLGNSTDTEFLFTDFMVDYLLASPSLAVRDVELVFGISDHAAITATLEVVRHD